jgi:hypothetical protein
VSPGDHIVVQVLMELPNVGVTVNGNTGVCYMQNLTTGYAVSVHLNIPPGITFSGSTAEWIMERPYVGVGSLIPPDVVCCFAFGFPDLANYSAASMFNAYAIRADSTVVNASGNLNSLNITMTSGDSQPSGILSEVVPLSDTAMTFRWKAFK